jgi:phage shock protein C
MSCLLMTLPNKANTMLKRSRDKVIAGVCGGIAEHLGWQPGRVRIVYVLLSVLSAAFPGVLVYLALWYLMPPPAAAP